jgi:hypothetical protein
MKYTIAAAFLLAGFFLISGGCRKCSQCTIKIKSTGAVDTVLPESCGSENDIDEYESQAAAAFPDSTYVVTCIGYDGKR